MAQHDYVIDNSTGANVRADINSALQAIVTNNSGSSAPSATFPFMLFADSSAGTMKIRNAADNAFIELFQLDGTFTLEDGSASTPALAFRDDLNTGIFSGGADEFNIATGGNERFVINSSGNCGIGCGAPQQLLHVFPDILSTTSSFVRITAGNRAASTGLDLGHNSSGDCDVNAVSNANLIFSTNNTERLRITNSGSIGIGTTSPDTLLDVSSSDDAVVRIQSEGSDATDDARLEIKTTNGTFTIQNDRSIGTSGGLTFAGNTSNNLVIRHNSGNVGISTASPVHNLSVVAANSATPRIGIANPDASESFNISSFHDSNGIYVGIGANAKYNASGNLTVDTSTHKSSLIELDARNNGGMFFYTGGTGGSPSERLRIDSNGRVKIGSTSNVSTASAEIFATDAGSSGGYGGVFASNTSGGFASIYLKTGSNVSNIALFARETSLVGSISTNGTTTSFNTTSSDRARKKNFEAWTENTLDLFKNINPQKFNFIQEDDGAEKTKGFVAQDLVDSFPESYSKDPDDKYMFNPSGMVIYLMKAIQELEAKVAALEAA